MIGQLAKIFANMSTDWSKWKFFFCDERLVPFDNPDSTFGAYKKALADVIDITEEHFITIDPELSGRETLTIKTFLRGYGI